MKRLIYTKPTADVAIGHLYEHIFCNHLIKLARSHGLFSYVDYSLDAKNYHDGYIYLQIDLYTDFAENVFIKLLHRKLEFSDNAINGALLQITAETKSDVSYLNNEGVLQELNKCQRTPWQSANKPLDLDTLKQIPSNTAPLLYSKAPIDSFGRIKQSISLDIATITSVEPNDAIVLFIIVSKAIRSNLQEDIANNSFCFTYKDYFKYNKDTGVAEDINLFRIDKRQATDITTEPTTTKELLEQARVGGFSERLSQSIQHAAIDSDEYPNEEEIFAKARVHLTPSKTSALFTKQAINTILDAIAIDFSYK